MILDFFDGNLDGDSWERICQDCYRIRYQNEHYTEIPAVQGGDAGIEGFTLTGVVNQCYCPEREYTENELHEHLRDKMTDDIAKLISMDAKKNYKQRLKNIGVPLIKEWHFVIPYYKDARILQHAHNKQIEVLNKKKEYPDFFDYIDDNFVIVIKQAEDFRFEITRIIRNSITDTKLNLAVREIESPDWSQCDSEKVENIKRKVEAVMGDRADKDSLNLVVNTYIESYIKGMEILRVLRVSYAEIYEDVYRLEQAYKKQVKIKTNMNTEQSMNSTIFNEILSDFEKQLKEECKYFTMDSIFELKTDIISMWLADCSMQFRK